mmetsp:Transcript_9533/g.14034  ORF Transcript_9533/g.14034 Transcript_9533/m.14034 type:complete len:138 (-) Transcript_9533:899-1312(-)|eukprot:CAMPEP_0197256832 /NCGR_PEP_ID=MMETSP1429-20130617/76709_1 /TAXON_ID=49237 /ORGANISM="Chaetoceros  sp., Strain UNC1202" /LENGTH=137 /DNA_ID=CAMNT_0042720507 /DNA_START=210 /DNA_END=623 /DNA_ORIENTATION=+
MGNQPSAPTDNTLPNPNPANSDSGITIETNNSTKPPPPPPKKKKAPPPHLKGFALVEYKCRRKRRAYDLCHKNKHSAFVGGKEFQDGDGEEQSCDDLFDIYKECVYKGMLKDRQRRNVGAAGSESALGDYAEDADED